MQIVLETKKDSPFRVLSKVTKITYNCKKFILDLENKKITTIYVDGDWWESNRFVFIEYGIELLEKIPYWLGNHCESYTDKIHINNNGHIDKIYAGHPRMIMEIENVRPAVFSFVKPNNKIVITKQEIIDTIVDRCLKARNENITVQMADNEFWIETDEGTVIKFEDTHR